MMVEADNCPMCGASEWQEEAQFTSRPEGETDFGITDYDRHLISCGNCGHVLNIHHVDLDALYDQDYWDKTYSDKITETFHKIMSLPPDRSDNRLRVAAINRFWQEHGPDLPRTLLDIGAGLAVFPAAMKESGWQATALDPDVRAAEHARKTAGVEALQADFLKQDLNCEFSLVTLNKVLEHVPDPGAMLARVHKVLAPRGLVYVELPDGEGALKDSPAREEFFIEHYCAFSMASMMHMCQSAGFKCDSAERLREPSGKYTLRAFLRVAE